MRRACYLVWSSYIPLMLLDFYVNFTLVFAPWGSGYWVRNGVIVWLGLMTWSGREWKDGQEWRGIVGKVGKRNIDGCIGLGRG
ncbi:hypothetical protein VTL71DRAFT_15532 [Oculimacula yallundae]|uniref:Uncharacterized protein n=1 Tax=Oculimacula yallundae TaxID=86028 RepID=A0ABR4CHG7_9HELO